MSDNLQANIFISIRFETCASKEMESSTYSQFNITYAEYATFKVANQADKYRIVIGGYSGTAGDGMNKQRYNIQ